MLNLFNRNLLKRFVIGLSLVVCILVSGVYAPSAIAQTFKPEAYLAKVEALGDRFSQLETYVNKSSWSDVKGLIHGPLGEISSDIARLTTTLPRKSQASAKALAKKLTDDLIALDFANKDHNASATSSLYAQVRKDYEGIVELFAQ